MTRQIIFWVLIGLLLLPATSMAGSRAGNGFVGGGIAGALIGQAIGRDTEATLIGTAVGGMLGYMIGNENDKAGSVTYRRVVEAPRPRVVEQPPPHYREVEPVCREAEVMAYVDGRPERVWTTVCRERGEWVVAAPSPVVERTVIIQPEYRLRSQWVDYRPVRRGWGRHCPPRHKYGRGWGHARHRSSTRLGLNVVVR